MQQYKTSFTKFQFCIENFVNIYFPVWFQNCRGIRQVALLIYNVFVSFFFSLHILCRNIFFSFCIVHFNLTIRWRIEWEKRKYRVICNFLLITFYDIIKLRCQKKHTMKRSQFWAFIISLGVFDDFWLVCLDNTLYWHIYCLLFPSNSIVCHLVYLSFFFFLLLPSTRTVARQNALA